MFKNEEVLPEFTAKGIQKAKEKLAVVKMSPQEKAAYEAYIIRMADEHSATLTPGQIYRDKAERRILKSRKQGEKVGRKKGRKQGRKQGRVEQAKYIARKLLQSGHSQQEVSDLTSLSLPEIERL